MNVIVKFSLCIEELRENLYNERRNQIVRL